MQHSIVQHRSLSLQNDKIEEERGRERERERERGEGRWEREEGKNKGESVEQKINTAPDEQKGEEKGKARQGAIEVVVLCGCDNTPGPCTLWMHLVPGAFA